MVSQDMIVQVMKKLNRPCTAKEIANYMRENNLTNLPSKIEYDISNVLNILRRWEIVDKFPDLHGSDSNKWYLRLNYTHDSKNCHYCRGIEVAHTNNTYMHMIQSYNRQVRKVTDKDHMISSGEFEITTRDW